MLISYNQIYKKKIIIIRYKIINRSVKKFIPINLSLKFKFFILTKNNTNTKWANGDRVYFINY